MLIFLYVRNYYFMPFLDKVDNLERLFLARLQISNSKARKPCIGELMIKEESWEKEEI